jgi:DNA transposition AAA+ family ATPase
MTDEIKNQIVTEANKWVEPGNDNRSQKKLSKKIGISDATLSNLRKGKWENIGPGIWNKCLAYFKSTGVIKTESEDVWQYFDYTPEAEIITDVIKNAHRYQRRAAIDGPTGKGKTETIKQLVNKDKTNEIIHILGRKSMNPKTFCINLAEQLGLSQISSNRYQLEEDIAEKLLSLGKPCIVFDELENLSLTCYSSIKTIIDLTDGHCGIVMVGIDLWKMIHSHAIKGKDAFLQIQRRFPVQSYEFIPEGIEADTMKRILIDCGIKNKYAHEWFEDNVYDYDALKNTVKDALRIARKNKVEVIDREFLAHLFTPKGRKSYRKDQLKRAA